MPAVNAAPARRLVVTSEWLYLLPILLVLATRARLFDYIADDAYLSLRYAQNLVAHGELAFNPGERVEGVTNLLWTLLLVVPHAFGWSAEAFAQVAGMLAAIFVVVLTAALGARRGVLSFAEACVPALFVAALAPLPLWAQSGLETALFSLLVLALFWAGERMDGARDGVWLGLLGGFAFAVLPEGALGAALVCSVAVARRRAQRSALVAALAAFTLAVAGITTFRALYYGAWLPEAFAAQRAFTAGMLGEKLADAWAFSWHYLLLPCLALIWFATRRHRLGALLRAGLTHPFVWCSVCFALYGIVLGGDSMPFSRFFVPVLPLIFLTVAELAKRADLPLASSAGLLHAVTLLAAMIGLEFVGSDMARLRYQRDQLRPALELLAEGLKEQGEPATIALGGGGIGLVPYRTRLPTLNLAGLTDRTIADSTRAPKPTWVFVDVPRSVSTERLETLQPSGREKLLTQHPSFARHYTLTFFPARDRYIYGYRRRGS